MNDLIYAVVRPPGTVIRIDQPQTEEQYQDLLRNVLSKGLLLYRTSLEPGTTVPTPKMPWILDKSKPDSQPNANVLPTPDEIPTTDITPENALKCPYCSKVLNSKSGKTLHIKNKHSGMVSHDGVLGTVG